MLLVPIKTFDISERSSMLSFFKMGVTKHARANLDKNKIARRELTLSQANKHVKTQEKTTLIHLRFAAVCLTTINQRNNKPRLAQTWSIVDSMLDKVIKWCWTLALHSHKSFVKPKQSKRQISFKPCQRQQALTALHYKMGNGHAETKKRGLQLNYSNSSKKTRKQSEKKVFATRS